MDAYSAITTAMTVRDFKTETAPMDSITRILNAARSTASGSNKQPWSFVVVTDRENLKKIADLAQTGRQIGKAAFAIAVVTDPGNRWSEIDTSRAVQNMTIQGWAEGLGSGWVGNMDREKIKELLSIPEKLNLFTVIPFGYPTVSYKGKKNRKKMNEIAFLEKYGRPFEAHS